VAATALFGVGRSSSMRVKKTSAERALQHACREPSNTTLLVGAGVSVDPPSNVPLAGPIMDLLCEWLSRGAPDVRAALAQLRQPARARKPYLGPYANLRFELLLEWIVYVEPRVLDVLAESVQWGTPNRWHWWIADMLSRGAQVLTTNFDTRIEDACRRLGVECTTVVLSRHAPPAGAIRGAQLVKLHGTFASRRPFVRHSTAPVATLRQMSRWGLGYERLGPARDELLQMIGDRTLIVCGYSGSDSFDVMPLLEEADRHAALVWYEWSRGPLRQVEPPRIDALTTRRTTASMSDFFLAHISRDRASPLRIRGNAPAFLRLVTESNHAPADSSFGAILRSADGSPQTAGEVLDRLRGRLFSGELRLRRSDARAVVRRLRLSIGVDIDHVYAGLKERQPAAVRPMRQEADVLAALDAGDIRWATAQFLEEIRRDEDPGDRAAHAETVTSILAEMFWFAIRNHQYKTAEFVVTRLAREAERRGVLWAYPEALYLRANLLHELGLNGESALRGHAATFLSEAKAILQQAIRYAMRVPRLDIVTDAIRLLLYIEHDPAKRKRLLLALRVWSQRLDDGEEKLLALFDLVRHHVNAGLRPPKQIFLELHRTVRRCPHLTSGRGYLATASCYMALATRSFTALRKTLRNLDRVVARLHPKLRAPFLREADEFRAILAAGRDGRRIRLPQ
jgi:hypothetical protein